MASFLKLESIGADDLSRPDLMCQLRSNRVDAILVHDLFPADLCQQVVAGLEQNTPGFETTDFPQPFRSFFYGRNLNLSEPDFRDYFRAAMEFHRTLVRFEKILNSKLLEPIALAIARLDQHRPLRPAPGPAGSLHFFTTFRGHRPGGYIPPHFDNEQNSRPSYLHVKRATIGDIQSLVVTLAEADSGGVLELYDLLADATRLRIAKDDSIPRPDLSGISSQTIPVPVGSMVIVNSGRRLHRVVPVEGNTTRWTMCSFMALARSGDQNYCWG